MHLLHILQQYQLYIVQIRNTSFPQNLDCLRNTTKKKATRSAWPAVRLMHSHLLGAQSLKKQGKQPAGSHQDGQHFLPMKSGLSAAPPSFLSC